MLLGAWVCIKAFEAAEKVGQNPLPSIRQSPNSLIIGFPCVAEGFYWMASQIHSFAPGGPNEQHPRSEIPRLSAPFGPHVDIYEPPTRGLEERPCGRAIGRAHHAHTVRSSR